MILVFGGTTEGRIAVKTLDEGEGRYFYSTRSSLQQIDCAHGEHISGEMTLSAMLDFCRTKGIKLIIDAAHPFAEELHNTVARVAVELKIPAIRLERRYPHPERGEIIWCRDYAEAILKLQESGVKRLLALTGVQTIPKLRPFWTSFETIFRILERDESREKVRLYGFAEANIVYYVEGGTGELIDNLSPDAILTKESGDSGGFMEKVNAALERGVKVFVLRRPALSEVFVTVEGRHGLRMEVERLLPDFYPLHTGFTTGSCATAAAKAALTALLTGERLTEVSFRIPEGERMKMPVESIEFGSQSATATVVKEAGDDPDVTDGSRISVTVAYSSHPGIRFKGGKGIGTVTWSGLGLAIGEPAINPVPRRNIQDELSALYSGGLLVTISLENGDILCQKTFNPRVGVVGGLSIIGTTGIVRPFSHQAFIDCIRREMDVALAMQCACIVVNSGGRSERFMKELYPELPPYAFIHYGNAIGETMEIGREKRVPKMAIGIMLGKAVKLAEGNMDTHSHKIAANREFLRELAKESGCSEESQRVMENFNLARELPGLLSAEDAEIFFHALLGLCHKHCSTIFPNPLDAVLLADDGEVLSIIKS